MFCLSTCNLNPLAVQQHEFSIESDLHFAFTVLRYPPYSSCYHDRVVVVVDLSWHLLSCLGVIFSIFLSFLCPSRKGMPRRRWRRPPRRAAHTNHLDLEHPASTMWMWGTHSCVCPCMQMVVMAHSVIILPHLSHCLLPSARRWLII